MDGPSTLIFSTKPSTAQVRIQRAAIKRKTPVSAADRHIVGLWQLRRNFRLYIQIYKFNHIANGRGLPSFGLEPLNLYPVSDPTLNFDIFGLKNDGIGQPIATQVRHGDLPDADFRTRHQILVQPTDRYLHVGRWRTEFVFIKRNRPGVLRSE